MTSRTPKKPAESDVAALHMARIYDGRDDRQTRGRWAIRIRVWAHRHGDRVHRYGTGENRKAVYDLVELEALADQLGLRAVHG